MGIKAPYPLRIPMINPNPRSEFNIELGLEWGLGVLGFRGLGLGGVDVWGLG